MPHCHTPVRQCRVCLSNRILDAGVTKRYHLMNLNETVEIGYAVCQDCHFLFHANYVGDAYLDHYYRNSPMLRRKAPTPYELDQNARQAAFLSRYTHLQNQHILEIGAHAGAFLVHLQQTYQAQTYYDELSEEACAILRAQPGLQDLRDAPAGTRMNVIVLRHILEHIHDLDSFLTRVRSLLADDGTLFIETPDWSHLDALTDPLIFEHLNQFSTHQLTLLLRRLGWNCAAIEKSVFPDDPATPNRVQRLLFRPTALPPPGDARIAASTAQFFTHYHRRLFGALEDLVTAWGPEKRIAFYPASHLSFSALLEARLEAANIIGLYDIDEKKHGREVCGVRVYPADALREHRPDVIVLFTMAYEREIRESFARMGLTAELVSATALARSDLPASPARP